MLPKDRAAVSMGIVLVGFSERSVLGISPSLRRDILAFIVTRVVGMDGAFVGTCLERRSGNKNAERKE